MCQIVSKDYIGFPGENSQKRKAAWKGFSLTDINKTAVPSAFPPFPALCRKGQLVENISTRTVIDMSAGDTEHIFIWANAHGAVTNEDGSSVLCGMGTFSVTNLGSTSC